jgi:hypothetical protein
MSAADVCDAALLSLGRACCRPCVKDHNSIVLRAENVGNKYEWISRMMRAVAASAGPPPAAAAPVQAQPQPAADPRRASKGRRGGLGVAVVQEYLPAVPLVILLKPPPPAMLLTRLCC